MERLIFISYRRSDSSHAAQGLYAQLRSVFGPSHVFMDVNAIPPGSPWSTRIDDALVKAAVMLVVIGPGWLTAADKYGRRRLDMESDWVRQEIEGALSRGLPLIPIRIAGLASLPDDAGLPTSIVKIREHQDLPIRDESWDRDLQELVRMLVTDHNFVASEKKVRLPTPAARAEPLSPAALDAALLGLRGWEPVESLVPGDYPKSRRELRKAYGFRSFADAITFMQTAVPRINEFNHHPRWENQWKTLTVWLTTWDIGNRITDLDVELALELDQIYAHSKRPMKE